jgi:hypothetical protein
MEPQKNQIAKAILSKKKKARSMTLLDFKIYCKAIIIKATWYWHKKTYRTMVQNRETVSKLTHLQPTDFQQRC